MKVGLQMYSVRDSFAADPLGTLEKVAEAGYHYVEFANKIAETDPGVGVGISADVMRAKLESLGIKPVGCHIGPFTEEGLDGFIKFHGDLGTETIGMSKDFWPTREYLLERCRVYNRIGERCRKGGIQFLYHNHYHEFQLMGGERILDIIAASTDPEFVALELDAYWAFRGTEDPAARIHDYGSRVRMIHEKDFPLEEVRYLDVWTRLDRNTPVTLEQFQELKRPSEFVELCDGMIKVQDVIDAGNAVGARYFLVELDFGREPTEIDRIVKSRQNMQKLHGIDWQ
ncbi:MAG: sugar phosphate isomerase/epimerase [Candidatus Limnocylindrales bacterium]